MVLSFGRDGSAQIVGALGAGVHRKLRDRGKRDIPDTSEGRFQAGAITVVMGIVIKKWPST
jgi:hypothetical protein